MTDDDGLEPAANEVTLRFAARFGLIRLARLCASSLGSDAGFDVDELDDLRIAVDELCTMLVEPEGDDEVEIHLHQHQGSIRVTGARATGDLAPIVVDDLLGDVLAATTDSYEIDAPSGTRRVSLVKRARATR